MLITEYSHFYTKTECDSQILIKATLKKPLSTKQCHKHKRAITVKDGNRKRNNETRVLSFKQGN